MNEMGCAPSKSAVVYSEDCFVTGTPVLPLFQACRALCPHCRNLSGAMNPAAGAKLSATVNVSYKSIRYSFTSIVYKFF